MGPVDFDNSMKVVLFDHDDTLVSTIRAKWAQHKYVAKKFYGKELCDDEIRLHWGKPLTVLIKNLYETDNIDMAMSYNLATREKFPKSVFEDTLDTLATLQKLGLKLGLVTATTLSSLEHDLKTLKIPKDLFQYIQTEDDTVVHKPDPRVFDPMLRWLSAQNIQPSEVVYVGDAITDMKAALGAGFSFIGVCTGLISSEEFTRQNVQSVQRLGDLKEFFPSRVIS
jgi:HAD superfamily hydrolase (TIGR01549 family)